jgi:hypothetical protein
LVANTASLSLTAGAGVGADAYISVPDVNDTVLRVAGDLGISSNGVSQAYIQSGTFSAFSVAKDIYMFGTIPYNSAIRKNGGGNFNISAGGAINLRASEIANKFGSMTILAGTDIIMQNGSFIHNETDSDLTLVVDNDYPVPDLQGNGSFVKSFDSILSTSTVNGKVRIFTSSRDFNSIEGLINFEAFHQSPLGTNTNQERWGVYYPDSFFGGPGFTIFYKSALDISFHLNYHGSRAAKELYIRLNNMLIDLSVLDYYEKYILRRKYFSVKYLFKSYKFIEKIGKQDKYTIKLCIE